jgi:N-acetylglucosaminyldiphosphoundecaprenol N-acetyl-beta-D-mannosaminyltransferase
MEAIKSALFIDGIKLTPLATNEVIESIAKLLNNKNKSFLIIYINAYVYCLARRDAELNAVISEADFVLSDGISIVYAAFLLKRIRVSRSIMTHVFDQFIASPELLACKGILIGTTEAEANRAMEEINKKSHNIRIIEAFSGFCSNEQYTVILKKYVDIDFILIGMSTPKSELLCKLARNICNNSIIWHIGGGTIKCYAGTKRRPPEWIIKMHIEWMHRFIFEKHTRKRYLLYNFMFLYYLASGIIKNFTSRYCAHKHSSL